LLGEVAFALQIRQLIKNKFYSQDYAYWQNRDELSECEPEMFEFIETLLKEQKQRILDKIGKVNFCICGRVCFGSCDALKKEITKLINTL